MMINIYTYVLYGTRVDLEDEPFVHEVHQHLYLEDEVHQHLYLEDKPLVHEVHQHLSHHLAHIHAAEQKQIFTS